MRYTFGLIKPDAMKKNVQFLILEDILRAGFKICGLKMVRLSKDDAERFYASLREKAFFDELTDYMCSSPILCFVLEKENALEDFRKLLGGTDPQKAEANTLRRKYGEDISANAVHGSDSKENFEKEKAFFFAESEIFG